MDFYKFQHVNARYGNNLCIRHSCSNRLCVEPALSLEADCHGDSLSMCKKHWLEFIEESFSDLDSYDVTHYGNYVKTEDCPPEFVHLKDRLYKYEPRQIST